MRFIVGRAGDGGKSAPLRGLRVAAKRNDSYLNDSTPELPNHIAFGIQQPWAELILRGIKTIEIRRLPVRPGGPIYLYASKQPSKAAYATAAAEKFGLEIENLPRGVLVGTIEVAQCRPTTPEDAAAACVPEEFLLRMNAWVIGQATRLESPQPILNPPFGMWFYPFAQRGANKRRRDRE